MRCQQQILDVCWWAHVSNAEVLQRSGLSIIRDVNRGQMLEAEAITLRPRSRLRPSLTGRVREKKKKRLISTEHWTSKADKKAWLIQKGTKAQEAAQRKDSKTLFHIVSELTGMQSNSNIPVKDKSGKILTTEEQKARWVEVLKY